MQIATEFSMRTTDVIDRITGLEAMGRLTGIMDERGKVGIMDERGKVEKGVFVMQDLHFPIKIACLDTARKYKVLFGTWLGSLPPGTLRLAPMHAAAQ